MSDVDVKPKWLTDPIQITPEMIERRRQLDEFDAARQRGMTLSDYRLEKENAKYREEQTRKDDEWLENKSAQLGEDSPTKPKNEFGLAEWTPSELEEEAKPKDKRSTAVEERLGGKKEKITVEGQEIEVANEILYGGEKGDRGWAPVPASLLRYRDALGLSRGDFELVCRLIQKVRVFGEWAIVSARAIERDSSTSQNTFRAFVAGMETKGYLAIQEPEPGGKEGRNKYNIDGLWRALALCVAVGSGKVSEEGGREAAKKLGLAIPKLERDWQGGEKIERGPRGMPTWMLPDSSDHLLKRAFEVTGGRKYFNKREEYEMWQEIKRRHNPTDPWEREIPYEWVHECIEYAACGEQPMPFPNLLKWILNHDKMVDWQQRQRSWEAEDHEKSPWRQKSKRTRVEDETY